MQLTIKKFNFLIAVIFFTSISVQCLFAYVDIISFGGVLIVSLMWIPLLACLLSGKKCIHLMLNSVKRIDIKWMGIGIFTGFVLLFAEQGSLFFGRLGHLNDQVYFLDTVRQQIHITNVALLLGNEPQSYAFFAFNLCLTITVVGVLMAILVVFPFEACWRGVIFQELSNLVGIHKAPIFVGLLIGLCAMPLSLFGYINPNSPLLSAFIYMPLLSVGLSYVLAGLAINTVSAWPTAIALGIYFIGSRNLFLLPDDAGASMAAKGVVLAIATLWIRSALISRFEQAEQQKENITHQAQACS